MNTPWVDDPADEPVLADIRHGVGILTLNRPARLNAWTPLLGTAYFNHLERMAKDPDVRAILVCGRGRAFCAGADVAGLDHLSRAGGIPKNKRDARGYWFPLSIAKPIVAAIQGACYGVGLQQALCCDVRFMSDDVRISCTYIRRGLIGELGITWLLPRVIGTSAALDLALSGRTIGAEEARTVGLTHRVAAAESLFDVTFDYCASMAANCPPATLRLMKQQLYTDLASGPAEAFARSEALLEQALGGDDFVEAMCAFKEKREPRFASLPPDLWAIERWR
jgi:enoyl-CoA hydratase/carnithine racemase